MRKRIVFLLFVGASILPSNGSAQDTGFDIREVVAPEEFRAMGLHRLSADELDRLNLWLIEFGETVLRFAGHDDAAVIESRIDGDFECWEGDTIFRLLNGQVWQQTDYSYKYCYHFMPNVMIYRSGSGYKMKVDGVDGTIAVSRIK